MINTRIEALSSLAPDKQWSWSGSDYLYSNLNWLDSGTAPTESEIDAEVTRLNNLEPMRLLRIERDNRLAKTDWRASSDLTLSNNWKTYRQALRDLPASTSPKLDSNGDLDFTSVTFPTEPS
tara:strand:+ start:132 stop:497 length:366 start_codon:yes stop_codon:yes gene_type:complete